MNNDIKKITDKQIRFLKSNQHLHNLTLMGIYELSRAEASELITYIIERDLRERVDMSYDDLVYNEIENQYDIFGDLNDF